MEQANQELYQYLRQLVDPSQLALSRHPEFARVEAYWHLGRIIVETEQQGQERADYGIQLIESLSAFLTLEFGKGYRHANLWWFRQFYLSFPILHAVRGEFTELRNHLRTELTWTHYRHLISVENSQKRHFYLHTAADENWSTRTLIRLIKSRYYEQVALGEDALTEKPENFPTSPPTAAGRRSQVARVRQRILNQPNWAQVDIRGSGMPVAILKPDLLFYRIDLQRYVGIWVLPYTPAVAEQIRQQLDDWQAHPPGTTAVGLLIESTSKTRTIVGTMGGIPAMDNLQQLLIF